MNRAYERFNKNMDDIESYNLAAAFIHFLRRFIKLF